MFKGLGSVMGLLSNPGKLQEEMQKLQLSLGQLTAEGTAGAGYVTVKADGQMRIQGVRISDEAMALNDREMLEDLIAAATNQALDKVRELMAQESGKMAASLGLPAGMMGGQFPGMG